MSVDYYAVLGLERNASEDDIRRAYKKAAIKDHPDRNPGDKAAEERFKKVNEAYAVLSDQQKRAEYDSPSGRSGFGGFAGFDDMFAEIFGVRQQRQPPRGPQRGNDIRVEVEISLRDSMLGCKQELTLDIPERCQPCGGNGSKNGKSLKKCQICGGSGQIREVMGAMMFQQTCQLCGGQGTQVDIQCDTCRGKGQVNRTRKIVVSFPAGIASGNNLKVAGQGFNSPNGGPNGDLYVLTTVAEHPRFKRIKNNLFTQLDVSIMDAVLGVKKLIKLPDDAEVMINIPPGSQPNHVLQLKGEGVQDVKSENLKGDLHVELKVIVPRYISEKAAELIKLFNEETK